MVVHEEEQLDDAVLGEEDKIKREKKSSLLSYFPSATRNAPSTTHVASAASALEILVFHVPNSIEGRKKPDM